MNCKKLHIFCYKKTKKREQKRKKRRTNKKAQNNRTAEQHREIKLPQNLGWILLYFIWILFFIFLFCTSEGSRLNNEELCFILRFHLQCVSNMFARRNKESEIAFCLLFASASCMLFTAFNFNPSLYMFVRFSFYFLLLSFWLFFSFWFVCVCFVFILWRAAQWRSRRQHTIEHIWASTTIKSHFRIFRFELHSFL